MDEFGLPTNLNRPTPTPSEQNEDLRDVLGVRRALLVATGSFLDVNIKPVLHGVDPDVDLIRERLIDPRCGFQEQNVAVLKKGNNYYPSLKNINLELDKLLKSCGTKDFVFLYFTGHGFHDPQTNVDYYVPFDAEPIIENGKVVSYIGKSCFSFKSLREKLDACPAKFKWIIVDACRIDHTPKVIDEYAWSSIGKLEATKSSLWFQSCGENQKSFECPSLDVEAPKRWHSLFTWYFSEGAKGKAANSKGVVSPMGLFNYVCERLKDHIPLQTPAYDCQEYSDDKVVFVDLSDVNKIKAEKAFNESLDSFFRGEYKQALTRISEALWLDSGNGKIQTLKAAIEALAFQKPILPKDYLDFQGKEYRLIKAGSFLMGSPMTGEEIVEKYPTSFSADLFNDAPRHKVTLTQDYYLAKNPVTKGEFQRFADTTGYKTTAEKDGAAWILTRGGNWEYVKGKSWRDPGFEQTNDHPVVCVSYYDAVAYLAWLNEITNSDFELNGLKPFYRLPTEAEWEYACRAGTTTEFFWGDDEKDGQGYLNAAGSENAQNGGLWSYHFPFNVGYSATSPVGSFKPNPWGLYDMLGNVWEWTSDVYGEYPTGSTTDYNGTGAGSYRVLRGGSWGYAPAYCRCTFRNFDVADRRRANNGIRAALSLTAK